MQLRLLSSMLMVKTKLLSLEWVLICEVPYFFIISSDVVRYCSSYDAYVLTDRSALLVYNLKGVILLPGKLDLNQFYLSKREEILEVIDDDVIRNMRRYIRDNYMEDYKRRFPKANTEDEFKMLDELCSAPQVMAPWNCLTTDIESVEKIKTMVSEGLLR